MTEEQIRKCLWGVLILVLGATIYSSGRFIFSAFSFYKLRDWIPLFLTGTLDWKFHISLFPELREVSDNFRMMWGGYEAGYWRTIKGYAIFAAMSAAFLSAGNFTVRILCKASGTPDLPSMQWSALERSALYYLIGSMWGGLLWMILGSAGWISEEVAMAALIIGLLAFCWMIADVFRWRRTFHLRRIREAIAGLPLAEKILSAVIVMMVLSFSIVSIKYQAYGDTIVTHLGLPNYYLQQGSIDPNPYHILSYFSQSMEMLTLWALIFRSETAAALTAWALASSMALAMFGFCARRYSRMAGLLALLLFLPTSLFFWYSTTIKNDLLSAAYLLMHFLVLIEAVDSLECESRWVRSLMFLSGVFAGGAIAAKYTAIFPATVSLMAIFALNLTSGWGSKARTQPGLWLAFGMLLFSTPWFVRSFMLTGDPLYPYLSRVLGGELLMEWHQGVTQKSLLSQGFTGFRQYWQGMIFGQGTYLTGDWGPSILFIILGLLCYFFVVSKGVRLVLGCVWISWIAFLFYSLESRYHFALMLLATVIPLAECLNAVAAPNSGSQRFRWTALAVLSLVALNSLIFGKMVSMVLGYSGVALSGYSPGNFYQGFVSMTDELRFLSWIVGHETDRNDKVIIAGFCANLDLERKFMFSSDIDHQILIDAAQKARDAESLADHLRQMGMAQLIIEKKGFEQTLTNNIMRPDLIPDEATRQRIQDFIRIDMVLRARSPNGHWEWYSWKDAHEKGIELVSLPDEVLLRYPAVSIHYLAAVGSSRVDLQACKLEYSIVSPK